MARTGEVVRTGLLLDLATLVEDAAVVDELVEAEREGFAALWVRDRTASHGGHVLEMSALAAATGQARLGVMGPPPATLHPLRLAEDLAMLDIVSNGRLDWIPTPPPDGSIETYDESVEIVLRAWRGEAFAHDGPRFAFPALTCHPGPVQAPHPPIWLAAGARRPRHAEIACVGTWTEHTREATGRAPTASGPRAIIVPVADPSAGGGASEAVAAEEIRPLLETRAGSTWVIFDIDGNRPVASSRRARRRRLGERLRDVLPVPP